MTLNFKTFIAALTLTCCTQFTNAYDTGGFKPGQLDAIKNYSIGQSTDAITSIANTINTAANSDIRQSLAKELAAALSENYSVDAKGFLLRQLWLVGDAPQVPAIAAFLTDEKLSHMARYALQQMPSPEADTALLEALSKTTGKLQVGIINSIGNRKNTKAIDPLVELSTDEDKLVAQAAIKALGQIGGEKAFHAISKQLNKGSAIEKNNTFDALLSLGEISLKQNNKIIAGSVYKTLNQEIYPPHIRTAALDGQLALFNKNQRAEFLTKLLTSDDPKSRNYAARRIASLPGKDITSTITKSLADADSTTQILLLNTLTERADTAASNNIVRLALSTSDQAVKLAAINALAMIGDAGAAQPLVTLAANNTGELRNAARSALVRLKSVNADGAILNAKHLASDKSLAEIFRALESRNAYNTASELVKMAGEIKMLEGTRLQLFRTISKLATPESISSILETANQNNDPKIKKAALKAVLDISNRFSGIDITPKILSAYKVTEGETRAAYIWLLGQLGTTETLAAVRENLPSAQASISDAAHRAIFNWPNDLAINDAINIAKGTEGTYHILAMRGLTRMINTSNLSASQRLTYLNQAAAAGKTIDVKKLILSAYAQIPHPDAIKAVTPYLSDESLKSEAELAIKKITAATTGPPNLRASHGQAKVNNATDNNMATRWDSAAPQSPGMWFMIDLKSERNISQITLNTTGSNNDYPRGYELYLSNNSNNFGKPVVTEKGDGPVTTIKIKPSTARYIKIIQTGSSEGNYWSIHELLIK